MRSIEESIDELAGFLQKIGYDAPFYTCISKPKQLETLLKDHLWEHPRDSWFPTSVMSMMSPRNKDGNSSQCEFKIDYSNKIGLHIKSMTLNMWNVDVEDPIATEHRIIMEHSQIPSKQKANKILQEKLTGPKKAKSLKP